MTVVVTHSTPSDATFSAQGATAWDANHTLSGVGTMAEQNANNVAITGGAISGVTLPASNVTGVLPVANGGTGVTTSTGSGSNVLNTSPTLTTPAITGGTIDNTVIGATTPAAGTFTTITGQTEVLKGTGQNLFLQSQALATSPWAAYQATVTNNSTTAPDSTSTASKVTYNNGATGGCNAYQNLSYSGGGYSGTMSAYFKAGELTADIGIQFYNKDNTFVGSKLINLSAGTLSGVDYNCTSSLVSVGSGWYRLIMTGVPLGTGGTTPQVRICYTGATAGTGANGWYVWGCQLELGSTANTYIPTTTTAIYGTPTLSFSGVAGLGLQSDGSLYVSPAGTGALQAQATTSTATGGNARGANAVDFQMVRSAAGQVASSSNSFIGSGRYNTASGGDASVVGGYGNLASGTRATVLGGESNTSSGNNCYVGAGYQNTAAGNLNVVVGGQSNSGTSGSSVTTQTAATTSGSTAVTLSGSNANIKVGQWVEGTGINNYTYVSAVSGTSLTLTANATATNAAITLTFRTPFGTVVGGGNNQATGSYSFIGGGGDAGTAANRNVASGDWSFVGGGRSNTASGAGSFVGGGGVFGGTVSSTYPNTASGIASSVIGGLNNTASGQGSCVNGGYTNTANSNYSTVTGGSFGTTRSIAGCLTIPACDSPISSAVGINQSALLILARQTTDATATVLCSNSSAASGTNQVILPNNSAYYFTGEVISGVTGGGDSKGWSISGLIKRGANAASTTLVGSTVTSLYADAGATTWTIGLTADTTNGGLKVTFTGQASTTIRTVCQIRTTEMTY